MRLQNGCGRSEEPRSTQSDVFPVSSEYWTMTPTTSLPLDMLAELRDDNLQLAARMRETHRLCDENGDVASASLIEPWIDEAEGRIWFLFESGRRSALADA